MDVDNAIEEGGEGSMMRDDTGRNGDAEDEEDHIEDDEDVEIAEGDNDDDEEEGDPIVGNGFVEEASVKIAGSRKWRTSL